MPIARVQLPDGRIGRFEVVEGTTPQQVEAYAFEQFQKGGLKAPDPTGSFVENVAAGAGKVMTDMYRGAKQRLGVGDQEALQAEIDESRRLDAPLMKTGGGKTGAVVGGVATALPTMLIPGAATIPGAAAAGAIMGATQPTSGDESVVKNMAVGGALGAAGQAVGNKVASVISDKLASKTAEAAATQARNAPKDATLAEARQAGYVVPPSAAGSESFLLKRLESVAGKDALKQAASAKNQDVTNALARKAIGLADDEPITEGALEAVRQAAGKAYQDVAALSPRAAAALDKLKDARFESKTQWTYYNRSANPDALKAARAADQQAGMLERVLEKEAANKGAVNLIPELTDARRTIARSYDIEKALNVATGNVDAKTLGRMLDGGKKLTGELATAGKFAEGFGPYAREGSQIPTPGVSKVEALAAATLGAVGGWPAAALPLASTPIRNLLLSRPAQVTPGYGAPASLRLADLLGKDGRLPAALRLGLPASQVGYE